MQVKISGRIVKPGTPGRKYARRLNPESVTLAKHNEKTPGFSEKFSHPRSLRAPKCVTSPSQWGQFLQRWRFSKNLIAKEAAAFLETPFDTYRGWEAGKHTPNRYVIKVITEKIKAA